MIKTISGKSYLIQDHIYCPNGTRWEELKNIIQALRDQGLSVRVKKSALKPNIWGNTHMVTYYQEVKAA